MRSGGERRDAGMVRPGRRRNKISGQFSPKLIEMLESPAWRVLTPAGRKVIERVEVELANHGGKDNGKLPVTYKDFVEFGIDRHAVKPGLSEVVALGFLEVTRQGRAGNAEWRQPSLYRLTFRHSEGILGDGSHEWRRTKTIDEARELKRAARESSSRREEKKALAKKNSSGGKYRVSVGGPPTENFAIPVGVPPTTGPVGIPPLLSISRCGSLEAASPRGSRSAPVGIAVASEPLGVGEVAAAREKLVAMALANGLTRAQALAALDMADEGCEPPAATPPPPLTDVAAPAGRQMFLLQKWGASPAQARDLVTRLIAAAGPERLAHVDEMFTMVERWPGTAGRGKIAWLRLQIDKMTKWPTYRAQRRMDTRPTGRGAIVAALKLAPGHRATNAELAAATGKTLAAVRGLTNWMVKHSKLRKIARGTFTLPQEASGTGYATARAAILGLLTGMSGRQVRVAEIAAATGKSANAVSSTAVRMVATGDLIRGKAGFYTLPPSPRPRRTA
jgi:hypothetical protein